MDGKKHQCFLANQQSWPAVGFVVLGAWRSLCSLTIGWFLKGLKQSCCGVLGRQEKAPIGIQRILKTL